MSLANPTLISLGYGVNGRFSCEIDPSRAVSIRPGPPATSRLSDELQTALAHPLDFPAVELAVVPGDHVAIALECDTPEAATIVAEIWKVLEGREVSAEDVVIVQASPPNIEDETSADPRSLLPENVRNRVRWTIHDPADEGQRAYLATTAAGERIYLSRAVAEADFVLPVGSIRFDPILGYSGTNTAFYPGLSTSGAIEKAVGQGHSELSPDDDRPLRQLIDEVAWLLGSMVSVQVIPSVGGSAAFVLVGASESVLRLGRKSLEEHWLIELDERPEIVVAAVDADAGGHGWKQIGAALETARNLVARGGRIVLLTELSEPLGPGMELVAECDSADEAIRPLRELSPPDLLPATQLARAVDWADVYLLSNLDGDLVENLFMVPLENEREVERLVELCDSSLFIASAQHAYGRIRSM